MSIESIGAALITALIGQKNAEEITRERRTTEQEPSRIIVDLTDRDVFKNHEEAARYYKLAAD